MNPSKRWTALGLGIPDLGYLPEGEARVADVLIDVFYSEATEAIARGKDILGAQRISKARSP